VENEKASVKGEARGKKQWGESIGEKNDSGKRKAWFT